MSADLDEITLGIDAGGLFSLWTEVTISDTFLDPCQTVAFTIAADETRFDMLATAKPGSFFTVFVNGNPQCAGIIDSTAVQSGRSGTVVSVTGRDFLSRVVDGNADPRIAIAKEMPFDQFVQKVFAHFNFPDVTIFEEYEDGRNLAVGKAIKTTGSKGKRRRKLSDVAKDLRPKDSEGGWQWFVRIAHRLGYHAWIMPDGSGLVVGTPDYEQAPCAKLVRKRSIGLEGAGAGNNVLSSSAKFDATGLPSDVFVFGKDSKPGDKKNFTGYAKSKNAVVFKPFYVRDDESSEQAHCDAYARLILSRAERNSQTYDVTVRGASDPATGRVWNVDTVVEVDDEICGVSGKMWVESRTITKSRGGTTTQLRLIPCNKLLFDYYVSDAVIPAPKDYPAAIAALPKKPEPPEHFFAWRASGEFKDRRGDG